MKFFKWCFLIVLLGLGNLTAQWHQNNGRYANNDQMTSFFVDGAKVFGVSYYSVKSTTDLGNTWETVLSANSEIRIFYKAGNYIYATIGPYGLNRSADGGQNWEVIGNSVFEYTGIASLFFDSNTLFAGTDGYGVYKSTDFGTTWTVSNNGMGFNNIYCFAKKDQTIYIGTATGIYASSDNGDNWTKLSGGIPSRRVNSIIVKGEQIFAGLYNYGVYISSDNGNSWSSSNNGLTSNLILNLSSGLNRIFVRTLNKDIFYSDDSGVNWNQYNDLFNRTGGYAVSFYAEGNNLYAGSTDGTFFSTDGGLNWVNNKLYNISGFSVAGLTEIGGKLIAGTDNGMFYSLDNGGSWKKIWNIKSVYSLVQAAGILLAGTEDGLCVSTDSGNSWILNSSSMGTAAPSFMYISGGNIYAVSNSKIYKSTDTGNTWMLISQGLQYRAINSIAVKGNYIYAGIAAPSNYGQNDYVMATDNEGVSWATLSTGLSYGYGLAGIFVEGENIFAGMYNGLYAANDGGNNWTTSATGIPANTVISTIFSVNSNIFAGSMLRGVFRSTDRGTNWTGIDLQFPKKHIDGFVDSVFVNTNFLIKLDNSIYACTEKGIYSIPSEQIVSIENHNNLLPASFYLEQNYPNPFNPSTKITFSLPKTSRVLLRIYDLLGREIKTLADKELSAGYYSFTWNADDNYGKKAATGIYLYTLLTEKFSQTKKMILMK